MDVNAEREKIRREIEELERSLGTRCPGAEAEVSGSSLESDSEDGASASPDDLEDDGESRTSVSMEVDSGGPRGEGDAGASLDLPRTPETCLQMNLVYQEVLQEKIEEINSLLAQNREQQEKLTWELAGTRGTKSSDGKSLPANMFLGHFMKPYFKDKTSGIGPPANEDARAKARQGMKSFEELITVKWKSREKQLLQQAVVSDQLQRALQPKLMNLEYLNEKRVKCQDEMGRQILEKQIQEKEREVSEINSRPEESFLGSRWDEHDWEKIANINFEGTRNAQELRRFWQNAEHPSINKTDWGEEEVERLKEVAVRHNCLGWEAIAAELGTQRTAFQCLQKFQAYNKDFRRSEWGPEEDQMLLQLIQEMRVGKHIPYRKIAYYMEGRDSAQLIYRWTKRVDPSLKRGAWTPEEDALLLKAVAKYGERDWFKIRTEVPGRNDIQCRDRYLHALHQDIKKGKWSAEEETRLVELTEKYGVGHWAKIASELPHRSGGQCLSKWKVLLGYRRNRKEKGEGRAPRRRRPAPRASPGPSETSSDASDLDLEEESPEEEEDEEEEDEEEEKEAPKSRQGEAEGRWRVPGIELWVPTRKRPSGATAHDLPAVTLLSKGFDVGRKRKPLPGLLLGPPQGAEGPTERPLGASQTTQSKRPEEEEEGEKSSRSTKTDAWRVSLAYVKYVLRSNSYNLQRRNREMRRKRHFASASQTEDARKSLVSPSGGSRGGHPGAKEGMWKTTLYRRLMMAVTPWAGGRVQSWALRVKTEAARRSKADFISKQLESAHLTSRPLFTLFIQLLQIDVGGCMGVIQKRKSRQPERLTSVAGEAGKSGIQASSGPEAKAQPGPPVAAIPYHPTKKFVPIKAREGPAPASPASSSSSWRAGPFRSAPKPKTVSELLREKRRRALEAAGQQKLFLGGPPLLLSPPAAAIQPLRSRAIRRAGPPTAPQTGPLATAPPPAASRPPAPRVDPPPASLAKALGTPQGTEDASGLRKETGAQPSQAPPPSAQSSATAASSGPASVGSVQAGPLGPGPASGALLGSRKTPAPSVPPLAAPLLPAAPGFPRPILPVTWVVTPQGLFPLTIVTLPSRSDAPCPGQAAAPEEAPTEATAHSGPGSAPDASSTSPVQQAAPIPPPENSLPANSAPPPAPIVTQAASSSEVATSNMARAPVLKAAPPSRAEGASPRTAGGCPPRQAGEPPQKPPPPHPPEETLSLDYRLLSREAVAAVKGWATGGSRLPYLPPFLCSLKTLSALLLQKEALERQAASLWTSAGGETLPGPEAVRAMVQRQLRDNPAYQLLKGRFLAAFTFPAALAALPPSRVTTTLSGGRWWEGQRGGGGDEEEEDSSSLEEEEEEEEEEETEEEEEEEGAGGPCEGQEDPPGEGQDPATDWADVEQPGVWRSSRLRRKRKRRRL